VKIINAIYYYYVSDATGDSLQHMYYVTRATVTIKNKDGNTLLTKYTCV